MPNYFDNVSGLAKDFIDRLHPFYKAESLKGKKLILFMAGGGEVEGTEKYLKETTHGLVKYLKFELAGLYCFKALYARDLKDDPHAARLIDDIVLKCNSL